jgi:hypothetical protein
MAELLTTEQWSVLEQAINRITVTENMLPVVCDPKAGLVTLLSRRQYDDVRLMYRLYAPHGPPGKNVFAELFRSITIRDGLYIVAAYRTQGPEAQSTSREQDREFIASLVALVDHGNYVIDAFLGGNADVMRAFRQGLSEVVNAELEGAMQMADLLAHYCDALCRRQIPDVSDPATEAKRVRSVVELFSQLNDKDVFHEVHRACFARRLLQTTPHDDVERLLLEELQRVMGHGFTFRLEAMMHDRQREADNNAAFLQSPHARGLPAELSVQVLTANHWPSYRYDPLRPPPALAVCLSAFESHYYGAHKQRTLAWVHSLGTGQLMIGFPRGTKDVTGTVYQCCALMAIAAAPKAQMSAAELSQALNVEERVLLPQLLALLLKEPVNVLAVVDADGRPHPHGGKLDRDAALGLRADFSGRLRKFRLAPPVGTGAKAVQKSGEIEGMRKLQIDATVVRLMKSRRTMLYEELVEQATQLLARLFIPQAKQVKARVEDLVNRGYLKRDENDAKRFEYVA